MWLPKLKAGDAEHTSVSAKKLAEGFPRRLGASRRGGRSNETLSSRFAAVRIRAASRDWNRQLDGFLSFGRRKRNVRNAGFRPCPKTFPLPT
jgi:hypothetical protein